MNGADIIAIIIIAVFVGLGITLGFVRGLACFLSLFVAFPMANAQMAKGMGSYIGFFLAVFIAGTVAGFLIYGATRIQIIDAMEGVFGGILGFLTGWGIAKFVFTIFIVFKPEVPFTQLIYGSMIGMDIYTVSPYVDIMNRSRGLREPEPI